MAQAVPRSAQVRDSVEVALSNYTSRYQLPLHIMRLVAMEEAAILDMLWTLLPPGIELPGAATLATRNELIFLAQKALAPRASERMKYLLDELAVELAGPVITRYPEPCYVDPATATEAEAIADSHLCEGSGALWSAIRETVRSLEFQADARTIANGSSIQFGLYNNGGLVGIAKATRGHMAVSRLLSAAILSVCSQRRWTTITVGFENGTQPHVDRGNSECHPSLLLGLTHHCGGELWVQSDDGQVYLDTSQGMLRGVAFPTSASVVLFNGRTQLHGTLPWKLGQRCVLIAHTVAQYKSATDADLALLLEAGFVPPES